MLQYYKKKPVVIETIQYHGFNHKEIMDWANEYNCKIYRERDSDKLYVSTLEGKHLISIGNFVIKGVENEFYSCDPSIFEKTYEKVEE